MVDVELGRSLGEHRRREVGGGDPDVRVVEVDPDDRAGRGVETQKRRRPAPPRLGPPVGVDDEAARLQVGHERGDSGAGEAGQAGELRAARRSTAAQRVDDARPVQLPKALQRTQRRATISRRREFVKR